MPYRTSSNLLSEERLHELLALTVLGAELYATPGSMCLFCVTCPGRAVAANLWTSSESFRIQGG